MESEINDLETLGFLPNGTSVILKKKSLLNVEENCKC